MLARIDACDDMQELLEMEAEFIGMVSDCECQITEREAKLFEFEQECRSNGKKEDFFKAKSEFMLWRSRLCRFKHHASSAVRAVSLKIRSLNNPVSLESRVYDLERKFDVICRKES